MVSALTDATLRFQAIFGGVNVGGGAIDGQLLFNQISDVQEPAPERDGINWTGTGVTSERIPTIIQAPDVTVICGGWDESLLELVEAPDAYVDVQRWLRGANGVLETFGRRVTGRGVLASGTEPGFRFRHTKYTGPFNDPVQQSGTQGTEIASVNMVCRVRRLERFNALGGLWRYIDYQTGENLIAPATERSSRTSTEKTGLVSLA